MRFLLLSLLLALIAGCTPNKLEKTVLTDQERSLIRGGIDDVARGDADALARKMPPGVAAKVPGAMPAMRHALPPPPLEVSVSNANWTSDGTTRKAHAVYQIRGNGSWALVEASTIATGGRTQLESLYITPTASDPQQLNSFSLSNAGLGGSAMIAAMLAVIGVTTAALVKIWRSGLFRRRWLWTIGALVGIGVFKLDWTSGAWNIQPFYIQLLSVGAVKQPVYAPWVLSVSIPIVAIIALLKQGHDEWDEPGLFPEDQAVTGD